MPRGLLLPSSVTLALLAAVAVGQDPAGLAAAQAALQGSPALRHGRVGLVVLDLATGKVLAELRADEGFQPASTQKLVTAAVALQTLGPDFTFVTRVESAGALAERELVGDLVLVGDGDPSLGGRLEATPFDQLAGLAQALKASGLGRVKGRIVGLDPGPGREHRGRGWSWDYLHEDYAAPFGGLCFAENVASVQVTGTADGKPPHLLVAPEVGFLRVQCEAVCGPIGTPDELRLERAPGSGTAVLRGRCAADLPAKVLKVTVDNPTRYAATALRVALLAQEVQVSGPAVDADDVGLAAAPRRELARCTSPRLRELLVPMLKQSQNLYAEQLLRTASRRRGGDGSSAAMAAHAAAVLQGLGLDTGGMVLADGSGLSRLDLLSPTLLARLLAAMWRSPHRDALVAALPVAGVDGTLARRLQQPATRGRVLAKTGSIARVVGLAGFVLRTGPDAAPLAFAVLVNDAAGDDDAVRAAVDAFVAALVPQ